MGVITFFPHELPSSSNMPPCTDNEYKSKIRREIC
jgi:hypothetical protein